MSKPITNHNAYLKEKIKPRSLNVNYNKGDFKNTFNFSVEPIKNPYGDIALTTGYNSDPKYTSTFLMSYQEAMDLARMIIDAAQDAMKAKSIQQEADTCDAQLSFLVLKGLIDSIRIERINGKLENYEPPFYKYTVSAFKGRDLILTYTTVYNLSYFTTENEIQYWIDKLTDKERVKIYFDHWNPFRELEERKQDSNNKAIKSLDKKFLNKYTGDIKPIPIQKENLNNSNKIREFLSKNQKK